LSDDRFLPLADANRLPNDDDWCLIVHAGAVLLRRDSGSGSIPSHREVAPVTDVAESVNFVGIWGNRQIFAFGGVPEDALASDALELVPLRASYALLGDEQWSLASRAAQVIEWDRNHRFCGRCGQITIKMQTELGRKCPSCDLIAFPRISPATITLIERGDEILLAHGIHHAPGMYALIAGFVEAGETLEECVIRETREEIGIEVDQVRYFGSQSWPFPHSIMLGFTAQHRAGEITVDPAEITDARWFTVDAMPMVPARMSIARRLIDDWVLRQGGDPDSL
jgi:NAD+ diphosphatase